MSDTSAEKYFTLPEILEYTTAYFTLTVNITEDTPAGDYVLVMETYASRAGDEDSTLLTEQINVQVEQVLLESTLDVEELNAIIEEL